VTAAVAATATTATPLAAAAPTATASATGAPAGTSAAAVWPRMPSAAAIAVRMPMARIGQGDRHERVVIERRDGDLATDERLDVRQRDRLGLAAEADRVARRAGARGAADAVHVIFGILRQVVVENVAHARNV
jgi:hypothetical protein